MFRLHLTLLTFLSFMLTASAATLSVEVSPQNPSEGQSISYSMTLTNNKNNPKFIAIPKCPGWDIPSWNNPSTSRQMSYDSRTGQKVTTTYTWQGRAKGQGRYTISPMVLEVDGQRLTSKSLPFHVQPQQTSQFYLFQTSLSSEKAYIGQSLELHLDFLMADQEIQKYEQVMRNRYELAQYHYNAMKIDAPWTQPFHVTPKLYRQVQGSKAYVGVNMQALKIGKFLYRHHRLTLTLEPKEAGTFTIPAIKQNFYKLNFSRSVFGINAQRAPQPIAATSKPITLTVEPPPKEGQPQGYTGQVSKYLDAEVLIPDLQEGQEVQLHAPIPIQLKVSGDLHPASILQPNWNAQTELLKSFNISAQSMTREDSEKHTLFSEIVIRPKDTALTQIPSIELSYFDPFKKKYKVAKTKPFAIRVQAVDQSAHLEDQLLAILELKKEQNQGKTIGRIEGIEINMNRLKQRTTRQWGLDWLAPLIALCLIAGLIPSLVQGQLKRQNQKAQDQRYKASGTLKTIQASQSSSEILEAITKYINRSYQVTDPRKAPLSGELSTALENLLAALEAASYAPDGSGQESLKQQALNFVKQSQDQGVS